MTTPEEPVLSVEEKKEYQRIKRITLPPVKARIEEAKKDLKSAWDEVKNKLDETIDDYFKQGYYGFELLEDPYLFHPDCQELLDEIQQEVAQSSKYRLYLNFQTFTVAIVPNRKYWIREILVGRGRDTHFIHYTLRDKHKEKYEDFKEMVQSTLRQLIKKVSILEAKLDEVYFAPGMPGYQARLESFQKNVK